MNTLQNLYDVQRFKVKHRGIPFLLTFEQWLAIWQAVIRRQQVEMR